MAKKKDSKKLKNKFVIIGMCVIVGLLIVTGIAVLVMQKNGMTINEKKYESFSSDVVIYDNYDSYISNYKSLENDYENIFDDKKTYTEKDFKNNNVVLVKVQIDDCSEGITNVDTVIKDNVLRVYYTIHRSCGLCALQNDIRTYKVPKSVTKVETYYRNENVPRCNHDVAYKPMIYIYPEEEMDLTISFEDKSKLLYTYPEYKNSWNVHVNTDGNIYDYDTNRNYYGLYWEAIDDTPNDMSEGFVIKGEDTIAFLEEKLAYLGLNEREINEFIVYWINKLDNNYNYIYFRTTEDINSYMPLVFSSNPDTLIRIIVDIKPLSEKINVKAQNLEKVERTGYTVVEWGGRILN